ncbi:MAG: DegT/DnrJ/EryC1/StrS family aminotransferase [Acidobacteria bacterium]|nr:DegT/DnrJ/EryC1/StrS family aminotransferase [Acidobacteriota bacterium]
MKYSLASSTWDEKERSAIQSVVDSDMFTMGDRVKAFERDSADFFGSKYAVMVNSGSSANLIAVAALCYRKYNALKPGDEVIVPAVSWGTTFHPLQQYGLHCRFVDIDADTLNYDLEKLSKAVTNRTRMIVAVNLLGNPNDYDQIRTIINGRDIILLEDNCESMGAEFKGRQAGSFGLLGTFSSFFSHHISTMEGGIVVTDDEELYQIMLSLRSHGWTRHLPEKNLVSGTKSADPFEESFKFVLPGYNMRPGEIHAAIGIEQLKKLPDFVRVRRQNAKLFQEQFIDHPWISIQKECGKSSWFGFALILKQNAPIGRNQLARYLQEKDIACRPIVSGNFLKSPVLKYYNYSVAGEIVQAENIDKNGLFVGNHHFPLNEQIQFLKDILESI